MVALYKLINKKTGEWEGKYTAMIFDLYTYKPTRTKYIRSNAIIYKNDKDAPVPIEDDPDYPNWKCRYSYDKCRTAPPSKLEVYASEQLLKSKYF